MTGSARMRRLVVPLLVVLSGSWHRNTDSSRYNMLASSGATTRVLLVKTEREDDPYIKVRQLLHNRNSQRLATTSVVVDVAML